MSVPKEHALKQYKIQKNFHSWQTKQNTEASGKDV